MDKTLLISFLSQGRAIQEISVNFKITPRKTERLLQEIKVMPEYQVFRHRNHFNQQIFTCVSRKPEPEIKSRVWQIRRHPSKPYLWINLPDTDFKKIKIIPLSDIHYGEKGHLTDRFRKYVRWIAKTENAFCFLNGDLIGNGLPDSPGTVIFNQFMSPQEQIEGLIEELRPIAHKILWSLPGGHEFRTIARTSIDPSQIVCDRLGIPYFSGPVYVDISWMGYDFTFYCMHGRRTPATEGGKLNKAVFPLKRQEFVMFVICGHFHDPTTNKVIRICREREFNKAGEIIDFKLLEKKQYVVVCPSFFGYFGTYAEHAGYFPTSKGSVVCELYPNGDYHATKK